MFLWLISPKNVFHGERISRLKKAMLGGLIAFVYIFAYINLQEVKHRQKMVGPDGSGMNCRNTKIFIFLFILVNLLRGDVHGKLPVSLPLDGWYMA